MKSTGSAAGQKTGSRKHSSICSAPEPVDTSSSPTGCGCCVGRACLHAVAAAQGDDACGYRLGLRQGRHHSRQTAQDRRGRHTQHTVYPHPVRPPSPPARALRSRRPRPGSSETRGRVRPEHDDALGGRGGIAPKNHFRQPSRFDLYPFCPYTPRSFPVLANFRGVVKYPG